MEIKIEVKKKLKNQQINHLIKKVNIVNLVIQILGILIDQLLL